VEEALREGQEQASGSTTDEKAAQYRRACRALEAGLAALLVLVFVLCSLAVQNPHLGRRAV